MHKRIKKRSRGEFNLLPEAVYEAFMSELSDLCMQFPLGGPLDKSLSSAMAKFRNGLQRVSVNSVDYSTARHVDVLQVRLPTRSYSAGDDYGVYELLGNLDKQETHLPMSVEEIA